MVIAFVDNKVMNSLMKYKSKETFERNSITIEFIDNAPLTAKIVYDGMKAEISTYTRCEYESMNKLQQHGYVNNGEIVVDKGDENSIKIAYAVAEGINRIVFINKWGKRVSELDESRQGIRFSLGEDKRIKADILADDMRPALLCKTSDGSKKMIRPYTEIKDYGHSAEETTDKEKALVSGTRFFIPDEINQILFTYEDDEKSIGIPFLSGENFCVDIIEQPFHYKVSCNEECTEIKIYARMEIGIVVEEPDITYSVYEDGRSPKVKSSETIGGDQNEIGGLFYKSACALRHILQSEGLLTEFNDIDTREGVLMSMDGDNYAFKRVSGKKRPSIACKTIFGSIEMARPYSDELFDAWDMEEKSIEELTEMAEAGDAAAMMRLAVSYLNGDQIVDEDPNKAAYWMEKAAQSGDEEAQFNIGLFYAKGYGVERDFDEMTEWMKKAADNDDEDAKRFLDEFKDMSENYKKAEKGDPLAQVAIAEGLMKIGPALEQAGSESDFKESVMWAEKADAQGNTDACWTLALAYQHGRGVDIDMDKAIEYYRKGADAGNPACQHNLGCEYMNGMNLKKNERKGFELIKASAEQGYGLAMRDLGRCYQFANGTPGNMKTAIEWYEKALEVIDDPELERKTEVFKMLADMDPDFEEDYPETPSDDEMDVSNLPDGFMDALNKYANGIDPNEEENESEEEDEDKNIEKYEDPDKIEFSEIPDEEVERKDNIDNSKIMEVVESVRIKANEVDETFDMRGDEIQRMTRKKIDLFGASSMSEVGEIASVARDACDEAYASYQSLVRLVDDECRPLLSEMTTTKEIVEVAALIQMLNKESEVGSNFTASINGGERVDLVGVDYIPSVENKVIQKYWEQKMESCSDYVDCFYTAKEQYKNGWVKKRVSDSSVHEEKHRYVSARQLENEMLRDLIVSELYGSKMEFSDLFNALVSTWEGESQLSSQRVKGVLTQMEKSGTIITNKIGKRMEYMLEK